METQIPDLSPDEILTPINDGLSIIERRDGHTFGTDALLLASFVRKRPDYIAADFGAGTGVISLLCACRGKFAHIHAVEIQPEYASLIARNAKRCGFCDRITPHCADVRRFTPERELDVVFSNPPYMGADGIASPSRARQIARHEVCGNLDDFCAAASRVLRFGGLFYTVTACDRTVDLLCSMRHNGMEPKRLLWVCHDEHHAPSLLLAEAKKGAKPGVRVEKILHMYRGGEMTADYRAIISNQDQR